MSPRRQAPERVAFVCALFALLIGAFNAQRIQLVLEAGRLDWSATAVTAFVALFPATQLVTGIAVGRWVDRAGFRPACWAATSLGAGSVLATFSLESVPGLVSAAILANLSSLFATVAGQREIGAASTPASRLRNFNLFSLMAPIGMGVASSSVGLLRTWSASVWGLLPAAIACALAVLMLLVSRRTGPPSRPEAPAVQTAAVSADANDFRRSARLLSAMYGSGVIFGAIGAFVFYAPLLAQARHLSEAWAGALVTGYSIGSIASRLLFLLRLPRHDEDWLVALSFATGAAALWVLVATESALPCLAASVVFGAAAGVVMPATNSICQDETPKARSGALFGVLATVRKLFELTVLLSPALLASAALQVPFVVCVMLMLLAALAAIAARRGGVGRGAT